MLDFLKEPWPWYVAGPLIGLVVPMLLLMGNKMFGVSSTLRHYCAACLPDNISFFNYDWKKEGGWNLLFVLGTVAGGFLGGYLLENPEPVVLSADTISALKDMGVEKFSGLVPSDIFNWSNLATVQGIIIMIAGGFLVGFGSRYAGGCTSGHAISGLANFQISSLVAVIGFFIGGLIISWFVLPIILTL